MRSHIATTILIGAAVLAAALGIGCENYQSPNNARVEARFDECYKQRNQLSGRVNEALSEQSPAKVDAGGIEVKIGDVYKIDEGGWVDIVNSNDVINPTAFTYKKKNAIFLEKVNVDQHLGCDSDGFLNNCVKSSGGYVEVLGFSKDGLALVQYTPTGDYSGKTSCAPGVQYFVSPAELAQLTK